MKDILHLLDSICQIAKTYKKIEVAKGEGYNLFRVIDMTSNETSVHSAFIADLLTPQGMHQMETIFLELFAKQFLCDMDFLVEGAKVEREKYIGATTTETGGRLDIIITDIKGNAVIIENKIYASDQENQLIRYYNYAQKLHSKYKLFYLSLDGIVHNEAKTATSENISLKEKKDYHTISYSKDILEWLEKCREKVVNKPLIREGISHYINLIKYLTNQTLSKEMEQDLKEIIIKNPAYIKNLGVIKEAITLSEIELQKKFWRLLKEKMQEQQFPVIEDKTYRYVFDEKEDRISGFYAGKPNNKRYGFEFAVASSTTEEIRYAVRIDEPMVYGFFITREQGKERKISGRAEYEFLRKQISDANLGYVPDKAGYYLGEKNLTPNIRFKTLDSDTLERLATIEETVSGIVESICRDITKVRSLIQKELSNLQN